MVSEMGYNRAAAMGVLANIKYESSYNPDCNGDGGTSYGICQWHAGRKTNLISWCEENLLDYTTLDGQLRFFKYEITSRYASVHSYLRDVENSADGPTTRATTSASTTRLPPPGPASPPNAAPMPATRCTRNSGTVLK